MRLGGAALALCLLAWGCGDDAPGEFRALAEGTVVGTVTGTGGAPLDSVRIELTVPSQVAGLFDIGGGGGQTDAEGRFTVPVSIYAAPDLDALPDTLAIYITATAFPPRYPPPQGETLTHDSVLAAVALAPVDDPAPVTEVELTLPVARPGEPSAGGQ
jgi:hypothetical protein